MPPSCVVFFPHEDTNFGGFFLKSARMKADTLTKVPLLHSLGLSQNPNIMPRNHRLFSALLKLQQNKSGSWKQTWGWVWFPFFSFSNWLNRPSTNPDTDDMDFAAAVMFFTEVAELFLCTAAESWLTASVWWTSVPMCISLSEGMVQVTREHSWHFPGLNGKGWDFRSCASLENVCKNILAWASYFPLISL